MSKLNSACALLIGVALTIGYTASVSAGTLSLSYSETASGTTGSGTVTSVSPTNSYVYGNSQGNLTTTLFTPTSGNPAFIGINYEFYDDYVFTISGATVNSVSSTINLSNVLSIDNLSARLYDASLNPVLPVLGLPTGGAIDAWSTTSIVGGNNVTVSVLNNTSLNAGTYVLELRGSVSGTLGGSYSGVLNVTAVPVPAAAWLMGSALAGLLGVRRRAKA